MHIVDTAPTADIQEMLATSFDARFQVPRQRVTRPLLDAAGAQRLKDAGVYAPMVAACCADPKTLDKMARRCVDKLSAASYSSDPKATVEAIADNPCVANATLWRFVDGLRDHSDPVSDALAERVLDGRDQVFAQRLNSSEVLWHQLVYKVAVASARDTVLSYLDTPRRAIISTSLGNREGLYEDPQLLAAWIRFGSLRLPGSLWGPTTDDQRLALLTEPVVTEALLVRVRAIIKAGKWVDLRTVCESTCVRGGAEVLVSYCEGARLAAAMLEVDRPAPSSANYSQWILAACDTTVGSAPTDAVEQYPASQLFAAELLRRRGVNNPVAWRYLVEYGEHAGNTAELVAMCELATTEAVRSA